MENPRSVVVTGASTGIGRAIVDALVEREVRVFGSVRRVEDGERLRSELGPLFTPLSFDVTDEPAVRRAAEHVASELGSGTLWGLVNNAGIAVGGPLLLLSNDDFRRQLEVNVIGPFSVTRAFAPLLGVDRARRGPPGRIVNISSVSGKIAAPFMGPYAASKHALEAFSDSLRRELMPFGIDVIVIGPGAVATPIWDKARQLDTSMADGTEFEVPLRTFVQKFLVRGHQGLPARQIGELVRDVLEARRPKTRYAPVPNAITERLVPSILPTRTMDGFFAKALGLLAKAPPGRR